MARILFIARENILFFLGLIILSGCTSLSTGSSTFSESLEAVDPPTSIALNGYKDIQIPIDLSIDTSRSIKTASFSGGVHKTKGPIEIRSLKEYLVASLNGTNWQLVGEADYDSVMLAFVKERKTCLVIIYEDSAGKYGDTHADFYITDDLAGVAHSGKSTL